MEFLLTRPSRGATRSEGRCRLLRNFYSHAPRGARLPDYLLGLCNRQFLLTRPSRGATSLAYLTNARNLEFLLTRPSRGATLLRKLLPQLPPISTHTPLAGRDRCGSTSLSGNKNFYSHAPRGARLSRFPLHTGNRISTHTPLAGRDRYI